MSALMKPEPASDFDFDQAFSELGLRRFTDDVIEHLKDCDESSVIEIRRKSHVLGSTAWKIEAACDAELLNRAKAKPGRGNKDIAGVGVMAAVHKRAKAVGCTPNTILRNAQVFTFMKQAQIGIPEKTFLLLDQKGYFTTALDAADPHEAIKTFADMKAQNPRFKVTDAGRLLKAEGKTKALASQSTVTQIREKEGTLSERQSLHDHINWAIKTIKEQFIPACPDSDFAARIYGALIDDLRDEQSDMFDADATKAIRNALSDNITDPEKICAKTGFAYHVVRRILNDLEE